MKKIIGIAAWILSLLFLIIGLPMAIIGMPQGLICISAGVVLFPPLTSFVNKRFSFAPKWWMKLLAFFALAALLNLIVPVDATYLDPPASSSPGTVLEGSTEPSINSSAATPSTSPLDTTPSLDPSVDPQNNPEPDSSKNTTPPPSAQTNTPAGKTDQTPVPGVSDTIEVHFIDVGQADCILIISGSSTMLVDGGNNADAKLVVNYLEKQGITKLDYVIGTHPHEDHIGGIDAVIDNFDIGKVIMPKVQSNTKTFEDVLTAIADKGLKITTPVSGTEYSVGDAKFTILAPNSGKYSDTNDYSVVIKLEFGSTSFLLTGDAGFDSEDEMITMGYDLQSTVLKVGHHGSKTSTSSGFLQAVRPQYAVICVGKDNSYGHPTDEALSRLKVAGAEAYRTDEKGTIVITSDGTTLTFNFEK